MDTVDGLVIPGGESTTMSHLLRELDLLEPLRARLADGTRISWRRGEWSVTPEREVRFAQEGG